MFLFSAKKSFSGLSRNWSLFLQFLGAGSFLRVKSWCFCRINNNNNNNNNNINNNNNKNNNNNNSNNNNNNNNNNDDNNNYIYIDIYN